jgi:hypothetical protein
MGDRRGFERRGSVFILNPGHGCTVHSSDVIGRRGWCFWTALCAESRGVGGGVGGIRVWSENGRVQSELGRFQARWGRV